MNDLRSARRARRTLLISCILFFVVLLSYVLALALNPGPSPKGQVAALVLLWVVFFWQVFTVYHCGRFFAVRLLLYIYGIAALALTIAAIY